MNTDNQHLPNALPAALETLRIASRKEISHLTEILNDATLSPSRIAQYEKMKFEAKEKFLEEVFKERQSKSKSDTWYYPEKKHRKNGSEYYIYKARPLGESSFISSNSYEGLVEKLYDLYTTIPLTLESLYDSAVRWKASMPNISSKTMYDYGITWRKYIKDSSLVKLHPDRIDGLVLTDYYTDTCKKFKLTYSQTQDIRNVLSFMFKYCLEKKLISHNPTLDVDYQRLPYVKSVKSDKIKTKALSPSQTEKLLSWCNDQLNNPRTNHLHALGIQLALILACRYGELRAIKWSDIDFDEQTIYIHDQLTEQYKRENTGSLTYQGRREAGHIKGYEEPIALPLPNEAKQILLQIKDLHLSDEYVFPGGYFRNGTLNDNIKKALFGHVRKKKKYLPAEYRGYSFHSLRATAATNLYRKTHDIFQVQRLLHHTTPQMTMKYIKDLDLDDQLRKSMMTDLSTQMVNNGEQKTH